MRAAGPLKGNSQQVMSEEDLISLRGEALLGRRSRPWRDQVVTDVTRPGGFCFPFLSLLSLFLSCIFSFPSSPFSLFPFSPFPLSRFPLSVSRFPPVPSSPLSLSPSFPCSRHFFLFSSLLTIRPRKINRYIS